MSCCVAQVTMKTNLNVAKYANSVAECPAWAKMLSFALLSKQAWAETAADQALSSDRYRRAPSVDALLESWLVSELDQR
jgi:hypothetical protein